MVHRPRGHSTVNWVKIVKPDEDPLNINIFYETSGSPTGLRAVNSGNWKVADCEPLRMPPTGGSSKPAHLNPKALKKLVDEEAFKEKVKSSYVKHANENSHLDVLERVKKLNQYLGQVQ